jgi:hypothetical protein
MEKAKFARRARGRIGDHEFWAISRDDLILSKLAWARESLSQRQFEDIDRLLEKGDEDNILREIQVQDLAAVWDEFKKWNIRTKQ